ncbi:hypothetical protein F5148DRAFT_978145 [Russula earlei]|uniref:Uncharacterized protein n=1 Tax=Russula earlei TaxID=71964 RepID=A0ACC0UDG0_9AGAM|nr:hypothetical protein F5148DRAFT_978145 [Russula earlei]
MDFERANESLPSGAEAPPPPFTPYVAECKVSGDKTISHDSHLNEDGEALYRFLLSQAETPPVFLVHCLGVHTTTRTRTSTTPSGATTTESYTETVTDFSFHIGQRLLPRATQWTVGDEEPVHRGRMVRETGLPGSTNKAQSAQVERFKAWSEERTSRGLPPWVGPRDPASYQPGYSAGAVLRPRETDVLKSSWTLRKWADNYCDSRAPLKEFVYEKVVHGWNLGMLGGAIRDTIKSTGYRGRVIIDFKVHGNKVVVRPDSRLSRALSSYWLKILLIVTLVYPFLWLYKRFNARGGGRWTVAGGAYALKRWVVPSEDVQPGVLVNVFQTPDGPRILVGVREGEWLRAWELTIRAAVTRHRVDPTPLYQPFPTVGSAVLPRR